MMTGRRRWAIAAVLLIIVAALAITVAITARGDSNDPDVDPHKALLQQQDFPAGYVVSEIANSNSLAPPGSVTPSSCQKPLDEQFARNKKRTTLDTIVDNDSHPELPRYAQTVARDGESVNDAISVVRDCPLHSNRDSSGVTTVKASLLNPPVGCPQQGRYVRLTGSVSPTNGGSESHSKYLMAYLEAGKLVSTVTEVAPQISSADTSAFCVVVKRAWDRLGLKS